MLCCNFINVKSNWEENYALNVVFGSAMPEYARETRMQEVSETRWRENSAEAVGENIVNSINYRGNLSRKLASLRTKKKFVSIALNDSHMSIIQCMMIV